MKIFYKILFKMIEFYIILFNNIKYFFIKDKTEVFLKIRPHHFDILEKERASFTNTSPLENPINLLVVIPFKDKWELTQKCLDSLTLQKTPNIHLHVAAINNNSTEKVTLTFLKETLTTYQKSFASYTVHNDTQPFNFSAINNQAVEKYADQNIDLILFLNNDVYLKDENTISRLVDFYIHTPQIGALGCSLIYPPTNGQEDIIQHSFLAPGVKIVGSHPFKGKSFRPSQAWYRQPRIVPAVTGALLLTSQENFLTAQRFDEKLPTAYQDLDLCLKFQKAGKINWVLPLTKAVHCETATRKAVANPKEVKYMYEKWGNFLTENDFYSKKFTRWSEQPYETIGEGHYPWSKVI